MNAMNCETCEPVLIDLVGGDRAAANAVHPDARAHIAQCPSCSQALRNIEVGLRLAQDMQLLEPPPSLTENLLQQAAAHAASVAGVAKPHHKPNLWQPLLDFVGRFAMARQVGMVTITLLVVAVGLWSLPELKRVPAVPGGIVLNPDTAGEAGPAPGLQPAERLDLKVDLRARRIRSKEEEEAAERALQAAQPIPTSEAKAVDGDALAARENSAADGDPAQALDDIDAPLDQERDAPRRQEGAATDDALSGFLRRDEAPSAASGVQGMSAPVAVRAMPAPPAAPRPFAAAPTPAKKSRARAADQGPSQEFADALSERRAETAALGGGAQASTQSSAPSAKAASAPADASADDCNTAAFSRYERIVASAGTTAEAGHALLAMARCRTQQGKPQLARALLERATRVPAVAARARALLGGEARQAAPISAPTRSSP